METQNLTDKKYRIGGFAPGNYSNTCVDCRKSFIGDKRAYQCEPCAVAVEALKTSFTISGGTRLITDFMGLQETSYISYGQTCYRVKYCAFRSKGFKVSEKSYHYFINSAKFYKSYDWLLPVMFKFRDLKIDNHLHTNITKKLFHELSYEKTSVQELFFEVVEAIAWYNENK